MNINSDHISSEQKSWLPPFSANPYKVAFCGYSGSGKTTLISSLTKMLSSVYQIGYYKHYAYSFQMDRPEKDTDRIRQSGVKCVHINDADHYAGINTASADKAAQDHNPADSDIIFIEGFKDSEIPKILFIDQNKKILNEIEAGRFANMLAIVGTEPHITHLPAKVPYFNRDDLDGIKKNLMEHFQSVKDSMRFNGLVLTGGKSARMQKDKALLRYHDQPQFLNCIQLLEPYCDSVFVSCRQEQKSDYQKFSVKQIHDQILNSGPIGGIMTALKCHPHTAWLVVACDLPFLDFKTVEYLIKKRNAFKIATCFIGTHNNFPEPLCTIYEPKSLQRLIRFWSAGCESPGKILAQSNIELLQPVTKKALENINHPEEYEQALKTF